MKQTGEADGEAGAAQWWRATGRGGILAMVLFVQEESQREIFKGRAGPPSLLFLAALPAISNLPHYYHHYHHHHRLPPPPPPPPQPDIQTNSHVHTERALTQTCVQSVAPFPRSSGPSASRVPLRYAPSVLWPPLPPRPPSSCATTRRTASRPSYSTLTWATAEWASRWPRAVARPSSSPS